MIWQGEFGRMPISQRGVGRDHNPGAFTVWMAGAKIKGGQAIGASDEFGYKAEQQPIAVHDLHATILHLLGMDHTKLTYLYNGRNMRLTDVYGELIPADRGLTVRATASRDRRTTAHAKRPAILRQSGGYERKVDAGERQERSGDAETSLQRR